MPARRNSPTPIPRIRLDDTAEDRAAIRRSSTRSLPIRSREFDGRTKTIDYANGPHSAPAAGGWRDEMGVAQERFFPQLPEVLAERCRRCRGRKRFMRILPIAERDRGEPALPRVTG